MHRLLVLCALVVAACLFAPTAMTNTTPNFMNYQGRLTNSLGSPIDLTTPMTFTIYADSIGGIPIWTETQGAVVVRNGIFTVRLGSVVPVSDTVFKSDRRWLEIRVGTDAPLSPRTPFVSVAYAFRSTYADSCNFVPASDTLWRRSGDDIYRDTGSVGIGTATPANKLDVNGRVKFGGLGFIPSWPAVLFNAYHNGLDAVYTNDGPAFNIELDESANRLNFEYATNGIAGTSVPWQVGFVLRNSGFVGIGTNFPTERLQVAGIVHSTTGGFKFPDGTVQTTAAGGAGSYVNLQSSTPGTQQAGNMNIGGVALFGNNVGIGTLSPAQRLHVVGTSRFDGPLQIATTSGFEIAGDEGHLLNLSSPTGIAFQTTSATAAVSILTNNTFRLSVDGAGNVGIGTSTPAKRLHVTGMGMVLDNDGADIALWGAADAVEHNHYFTLLNATGRASAMGLKAGGLLIADNYSYADPAKTDLVVEGRVAIGSSSATGAKMAVTTSDEAAASFHNESSSSVTVWAYNTTGRAISCGTGSASFAPLQAISYNNQASSPAIACNGRLDATGPITANSNQNGVNAITGTSSGNYSGVAGIGTNGGNGVYGSAIAPGYAGSFAGNLCYTGTFGACSDSRYKKSVQPITSGLDKVARMQGVTYEWRIDEFPAKNFPEGRHLGFIAQQMQEVVPEAVSQDPDGYLAVDYARLSAVLVEAVKELKTQNDDLRKRLEQLEQRLTQSGTTTGSSK